MFENDDDLKAAFPRVEPPPGFEQRVMARLNEPAKVRKTATFGFAAWAGVAAMAMLSVSGINAYQQEREQQRAIAARDQLLLALQITGKTLDSVRDQLNSNNNNRQ
ncbi:hypothetical protein F183_A41270 [Bryobacterales bacterium F-183]|nr:hypothetical protein F183_A41270 [Bryobacterales bacterium F-183]